MFLFIYNKALFVLVTGFFFLIYELDKQNFAMLRV